MKYEWEFFGRESLPKIALVAPANGKKWSEQVGLEVSERIKALQGLGFCVCVPRYEDGSMVFEPDAPGGHAEMGESHARGVSAETGANQIIECAEKGWDVFPYMGGWGFVDKIGKVIEHFRDPSSAKPAKPIRVFCYSDNTFAAFLQSHHPDVFQFYSTNSLALLTKNADGVDPAEKPIFDRNVAELKKLLTGGSVTPYSRKILSMAGNEGLESLESVQYFPLHNDMIWSDSVDFDVKKGGEHCFGHMPVKAPQLETSKPYILGLEGFLQRPTISKKYDSQFPKYLEEFLRQRKEKGQLPQMIEIGLFATRVDGDNGYVGLLHNEETGLIEINDFNVSKILTEMEKQKAEAKAKKSDEAPGLVRQILEVIHTTPATPEEAAKSGNYLTAIPKLVKIKVSAGVGLDKKDIAAILESENEKIVKMREKLIEVCCEYGVPSVLNTRCGHTLNIGVVGGGGVSLRREEDKFIFEQPRIMQNSLAGAAEVAPSAVVEGGASVGRLVGDLGRGFGV